VDQLVGFGDTCRAQSFEDGPSTTVDEPLAIAGHVTVPKGRQRPDKGPTGTDAVKNLGDWL
jgi:hypothetical protein